MDFSDRIDGKRKSYRTSRSRRSRRKRETIGDAYVTVTSSDEEEEEGVERKLARLKREMAELKSEVEQRDATAEGPRIINGDKESISKDPMTDLDLLIEDAQRIEPDSRERPSFRLITRLDHKLEPTEMRPARVLPEPFQEFSAPLPSRIFDQVSSFDSRLSFLEQALGLSSLSDSTEPWKPVLPTLTNLDHQVNFLVKHTTSSSLETLSSRVRQLSSEAAALSSPQPQDSSSEHTSQPDPSTTTKIHNLHATLPTIESLSSLLPHVLDRLHSLRAIHADVASASERLRAVEDAQREMKEEIDSWKKGLEGVEKVMLDGEGKMKGNIGVVEGWVRGLEKNLEELGTRQHH